MRVSVSAAELGEAAAMLRRAADEMSALRRHRGPIRGKAQDGGDAVFAAAVEDFADRWMWGIELVGRDVDMLADALARAADAYAAVERDVTTGFLADRGAGR
ncbi:MAG TPA: hypothetical protein VFK66_14940 [Oryzihumus sp.]|nr:hypothetical protein [Oryzihumus sp.]